MALDPSTTGGNETPEHQKFPESVQERADLLHSIQEANGITTSSVQKPPMTHINITKRFYQTHEEKDPESRKKLAKFTLGFHIV